jgi:hypothetical protein
MWPARLRELGVLLLLGCGVAHGEPVRNARAARAHFVAADRAFRASRYEQALVELRAGYELDARPEYLIVFAQVYRASGNPQRALEACELYLATAPNGPNAGVARSLAEVLRRETVKPVASEPASPPVVASPPAEVVAPPPAAPAVVIAEPTPATAIAQPGQRRRRTIVWATVGTVAVVVAGVAIGLGVGLGLPAGRPTTFGTVPFDH